MRYTLLLILITIGLSSCTVKANMLPGNTPGNLNNYGIVATDSEWEYFWAGTTRTWDTGGGKLCKMKRDGSSFEVLSNDNPCYINVVGEWVYYIKQSQPAYYMGKIYRVRKNGNDKKEIHKGESSAMTVIGEWIYFINLSDGNKIYKIKTDGSRLTKLIDSKCYDLQYENNWFYYTIGNPPQEFTLYKFSALNSAKPIKVLDSIDSFIISNGWIYGSNSNNGLYKVKIDGTGYIKLFKERINNFNVAENYIYSSGVHADYFVQGKGRSHYIYKISLEGKQVVKLPNKDVIYRDGIAGIVGDYIYYWVNCAEWNELARMKTDGTGDEVLIDRLRK